MKINHDGKTYYVRWHHNRDIKKSNGETTCLVFSKDGERKEQIASGYTKCSKLDAYDKNLARKISLTRAIKEFDRPIRAEFWEEYDKEIGLVK